MPGRRVSEWRPTHFDLRESKEKNKQFQSHLMMDVWFYTAINNRTDKWRRRRRRWTWTKSTSASKSFWSVRIYTPKFRCSSTRLGNASLSNPQRRRMSRPNRGEPTRGVGSGVGMSPLFYFLAFFSYSTWLPKFHLHTAATDELKSFLTIHLRIFTRMNF